MAGLGKTLAATLLGGVAGAADYSIRKGEQMRQENLQALQEDRRWAREAGLKRELASQQMQNQESLLDKRQGFEADQNKAQNELRMAGLDETKRSNQAGERQKMFNSLMQAHTSKVYETDAMTGAKTGEKTVLDRAAFAKSLRANGFDDKLASAYERGLGKGLGDDVPTLTTEQGVLAHPEGTPFYNSKGQKLVRRGNQVERYQPEGAGSGAADPLAGKAQAEKDAALAEKATTPGKGDAPAAPAPQAAPARDDYALPPARGDETPQQVRARDLGQQRLEEIKAFRSKPDDELIALIHQDLQSMALNDVLVKWAQLIPDRSGKLVQRARQGG